MNNNVTARDVARLAGVSQSTVSRVYFGTSNVSNKTKSKVLAAADELGYKPNIFARSLITKKTKIIGFVMKGTQNPFYPQVLKEFSTKFKKYGYSILIVYTNNDEIQSNDIEMLLNYNVAGVIIADALLSLKVTEEFKRYKIPLVLFNRKVYDTQFYSVSTDNINASEKIAKHLIEKGATSMAYISGNYEASTSIEREQGFSKVLIKNSIKYQRYESDYSYEGGYNTTKSIINNKCVPSAFFVANDIMALGVLDALREYSILIPEETKVIGFDNIEMSKWPIYNLTTWEQPISEMVKTTINYIISEIENYTGYYRAVELKGKLIERKTT